MRALRDDVVVIVEAAWCGDADDVWLCFLGRCVVLRGVAVVCCATCVRDCVLVALVCCAPVLACGRCVRGAYVCLCGCGGLCVCMLIGAFECLCVVCVAGLCVGVWVRLRCDGVGLVAVAWTRVCMCVRGCGVCWCVYFVFPCLCTFFVVCVAMLCGCCWRRLVWMHVYCVG